MQGGYNCRNSYDTHVGVDITEFFIDFPNRPSLTLSKAASEARSNMLGSPLMETKNNLMSYNTTHVCKWIKYYGLLMRSLH